jgi:endonuclease III
MLMRWFVRREAPDLGLWTHLSPADLVIPLDTHVFRVAGFLGLTDRATPGWATAEAITASLRRFDAADPVRYDFALAHLGISGACLGRRDAAVCPTCPLDAACRAPATDRGGTRPARATPRRR